MSSRLLPNLAITLGFWMAMAILLLPALVHSATTVRVGTYDFKPLVYQNQDGKAQGIYVDLLNAISRKEDWTPAYVHCNWPQCLNLLEQGRIDLLTGILKSPEREEKSDFSQVSVLSTWGQLYSAPEVGIENFRDLQGKSIAVIEKGYFYPKLKQYLEKFNVDAEFVEVKSYQEVFSLTDQGEVDACSAERVTGMQAEKRFDIDKTPLMYNSKDFLFAAPKGKEQILRTIDEHLRKFKEEGEGSLYDRILQKNLFAEEGQPYIPEWLLWAIVAGCIVLVAAFSLNLYFRQLVRKKTTQLRQREQDLELTLNSIDDAVMSTDTRGTIARMNPVAEALTGWHYAEAKGQYLSRVFRIVDAETREQCSDPVQLVLQGDKLQSPPHNTVLISKQGTQYHISDSATPINDEQGEITGMVIVFRDVTQSYQMRIALEESEQKYRNFFENMLDAILLADTNRKIIDCNPAFESLFGYSLQEIKGKKTAYVCESETEFLKLGKALEEHYYNFSFLMTVNYKKKNGEVFPGETGAFYLKDSSGEIAGFIGVIRDITDRKRAEEALRQSENYYRAIFETSGAAMFIIEEDTTVSLANSNFEELSGYSRQEVEGKKSWTDFVHSDDVERMKEYHYLRLQDPDAAPGQYEFRFITRHGENRDVFLAVDKIPGTKRMIASGIDITERKQLEEKLKEMSIYDSLTGLYSRNFFEEEMRRLGDARYLPLGIVSCDINGLKLINDTLGHDIGDEMLKTAAEILSHCFRSSDIIARIGGDEFAVLLPQASEEILNACTNRIYREVAHYNEQGPDFGLSLAIGSAVVEVPPTDMQALFKLADDDMYKDKLQKSRISSNETVQALLKTLEERDYITQGHAGRLDDYTQQLGRSAGISEEQFKDLQLLSRFHDLGKVGVPDRILFKPGPLTAEEFEEMKRHCEIGNRIALFTSDLAPIADYILKHHEHWDGRGYPLGLAGKEIPLECRILAIVDAYDTMTHERPYKGAMSHKNAIEELQRCSGTQFDPELVEQFIQILEQHDF